MSAVAEALRGRQMEGVRWVICFTIVAALHGAAAFFLLKDFSETSYSGVDAVVMLELPESLIPSTAQDLPPGPVMEEESQATPPPKEETKPPETEAEVALPEPPKPQPQPQAEERSVAAPAAAKTPPASVIRWQTQLAAHIEHYKRHPAEARSRGEFGTATVEFTIDHKGHLLRSSIVQSSGSAALDRETRAMLVRAQPMPRPPDQLTGVGLTFVLPVHFDSR
jgi:protein TonB